jgi:hypothetical protein
VIGSGRNDDAVNFDILMTQSRTDDSYVVFFFCSTHQSCTPCYCCCCNSDLVVEV